MLYQVIIVIHAIIGFCIIGLVLMQQGKGADAGAAFGSGSSGSVFGAQGSATFLSKTTAIFAALFFTTSLGLAVLSGQQGRKADLIDTISEEQAQPVQPQVASDVPLTPAQSKAAAEQPPIEKLPEAPAIKEVEPAPAAAPEPAK